MPLLPELAAALVEIDRSGVLPAERYPDAPAARAVIAKRRAARMIARSPVASTEDRDIPGPAGPVPVRIYRPRGDGGARPLVVWLHGGGWTLDDLDGADGEVSRVCDESGCVVVSVAYRLAPEHRFPAALDDCLAACRWAEARAGELGARPEPIAVGGVSNAGNLAAAVSLAAALEGTPRLAQQLVIVPVLDLTYDSDSWHRNGTGYLLTRQSCEWYRDNYLDDTTQDDD